MSEPCPSTNENRRSIAAAAAAAVLWAAVNGCAPQEVQTALLLEISSSVPVDCVSVLVTPESGGPDGVDVEVPAWAEGPIPEPLRIAVYPGGRIDGLVLAEAYGRLGGCFGEVVADLGEGGPLWLGFDPEETAVHSLLLVAARAEHGGPTGSSDCESDRPARPDLCPCRDGEARGCFTLGPKEMADVGECRSGTQTCVKGSWQPCEGQIGPGLEQCNGKDDSCDGVIDSPWLLPRLPCERTMGVCAMASRPCIDGFLALCNEHTYWDASGGLYNPEGDLCYGLDNDCDGQVDRGCACNPLVDQPRACYSYGLGLDDPTAGVGVCIPGVQTCIDKEDGSLPEWGTCEDEIGPGEELCDGQDLDCSGLVDDPIPGIGDPCEAAALGTCREGRLECRPDDHGLDRNELGLVCVPSAPAPFDDLCDGVDATCVSGTDDEIARCPEPGDLCCEAACHPPASLSHCGRCGTLCPTPTNLCQRAACRSGLCIEEALQDGTGCSQDGGTVCVSGICRFRCYIGGVFYNQDVTSLGNDCLVCRPSQDPFGWTNLADGSSCGGGMCISGECKRSCSLPWGGTINHEESFTAYQDSTVGCYESCTAQSRRCIDGTLLGSYSHPACGPACAGCATSSKTWGDHGCQASYSSATHGTERTQSNTTTGRSGSGVFLCDDGTWSYQSGTCTPNACALPWGGTLAHGQSVTAYQSSSVVCGASCASQTRSCSYGVLSGSYGHQRCSPACANCPTQTLSWDSTHGCQASFAEVAHGDSRSQANTRTGRTGSATHSCNNGTWALQGGSSCAPDACALPWGGTLAHGESVTAYQHASVACGGICPSESRACSYGTLSGSFTHPSCSAPCGNCAASTLTWHAEHQCQAPFPSQAHQGSATLENTREGREGSSAFQCNDGTWELQAGSTCAPVSCPLPWGGTIGHGESILAYLQATVECGGTCTSESRECAYGSLAGEWESQSCQVDACLDCAGGTVTWGVSPSCEATILHGAHGSTQTALKEGNPNGTADFLCVNGTWEEQPGGQCDPAGG